MQMMGSWMGSSGDDIKHTYFRRSPKSFWRDRENISGVKEVGPGRRPTIDDLLNDNQALIDKHLGQILKKHRDYRVEQEWTRVKDEELLTCKFWPVVYNKPSLTSKKVTDWVNQNTSSQFQEYYQAQTVALQYLWARMRIISRSPQDLYWFVVWDNFWEHNYGMKCMQGNTPDNVPFKDIFGSSSSTCLLYNRCSREELESKLDKYNLKGQKDKPPHLFFPELLDTIFREMSRASLGGLTAKMRKMMIDPDWKPSDWKRSPASPEFRGAKYEKTCSITRTHTVVCGHLYTPSKRSAFAPLAYYYTFVLICPPKLCTKPKFSVFDTDGCSGPSSTSWSRLKGWILMVTS